MTSMPLTEMKTLEMDIQGFMYNIIQWLILKQWFHFIIKLAYNKRCLK